MRRHDEGRHRFEVPAFVVSAWCSVVRVDVIFLDLARRDTLGCLREG